MDESDKELCEEIADIIRIQKDRLFVEVSKETFSEIEHLIGHFDAIIGELETLADDDA